jgi:molecular chaperone Hsp33
MTAQANTHADTAIRALSANGHIRAMACVTTGLVEELRRRHDTWPVATAALGRTVSVAAMMALLLKGEERLTVQIKGDGPLGAIVVDADSEGHVRGYVDEPHVDLPLNAQGKLDVGAAVGRGMLYVMRDMGLRDVYRSSAELQTGEIGDDFTYYFAVSEQTPSAVGAGVLVDQDGVVASGGFIVQLLPDHDDNDVEALESRLAGLHSVTELLREGATARDLLHIVVPDAVEMAEQPLTFQCTCSRDRLEAVLLSLGEAEIQSMLDEQGGATVRCHFCNTVYHFDAADLHAMLANLRGGNPA